MSADIRSRVCPAARAVAVLFLLSTILSAPAASAQIAFRHAPEDLRVGEPTNLFVEVGGSERMDGFVVALPASWTLEALRVVDENGRRVGIRTEPLVEYANRWLILGDATLNPESRLILTVRPISTSAVSTATVTPVRLDPSRATGEPRVLDHLRSRAELPVVPELKPALGRSADFSRRPAGAEAERAFIPVDASVMRGTWDVFTLEVWMKTTALEEIVLSTWTGRDGESYPFEVVVDGSGHVVSYQGTKDHHVSMRSSEPVADGSWHHVALVHDSPRGWTRLVVDGESADSLVHRSRTGFDPPEGIALGFRRDGEDASSSWDYTGRLDQLRLHPRALSAGEIHRFGHDNRRTAIVDGIALSFDAPGDGPDIATVDDTPFRQRGVSDLEVRSGSGGVAISWKAAGGEALRYLVERSSDGLRYEPAGRVEAGPSDDASYSITDPAPGDGVMFYRVREVLSGGEERVSDAVKVGMGEKGEELTAILTGSFPNPFNPSTRISYTVREPQHIRISVWDLSGQQVSMLVDENVSPGYHEVSFDAEGLPSGTYFVRLITPEGTQTHQMVLMK
ncbi:MAG: T9SS type A sorting domain-containing protein [Rhodothermales bacterium]|nr:T9SS type A sorting domain-containing protein [Rhodothermales bacterium]